MRKSKHIYQNEVFERLAGNAVLFHPGLKPILGGSNAAIWLCQALFWADKSSVPLQFYKSRAEFERETSLTRDQQILVEKKLKKLGVISIEVKPGRPSLVNHITIHMGRLLALIPDVRETRTLDNEDGTATALSTLAKQGRQRAANTENITKNTQKNIRADVREPPGKGFEKLQRQRDLIAKRLANR